MPQLLPSNLIPNAYLDQNYNRLPETLRIGTNCGVCYQQLPYSNFRVYALACGHIFHPDCLNPKLKDGVFQTLQGKSIKHITCPVPGCDQPILFNTNFIAMTSDRHNALCMERKSMCEKVWCDGMTASERQMLHEFRLISIPNYEQSRSRSILKYIAKITMSLLMGVGLFFYGLNRHPIRN